MKRNLPTALFLVLFLSSALYSYPKFAAYTGEKCQSCHVNPTGGGIRNGYGVKYSKTNLFFKFLEKQNKTTDIETKITKGISIGADMRFAAFYNELEGSYPYKNTFFMMQSDLHVNAQVNKYISLTITQGLYIPNNTFGVAALPVKTEIFGMVSNLPAGLYFKIGRFIPNFGTKVPEHRAYIRQVNNLYTPYASDAGIEVGFAPSFFTLSAGFSNGSSLTKTGVTNNSYDFDQQKQVTLSGDFRWAAKKNKFTFGLGGSFINNPFKYDPTPATNTDALRQIAGGFLSFGIMERVAVLAELDYNRLDIRDSASTRHDVRTIFGEVDIRVSNGVELKFQYENLDNALGRKNASSERQRYSFGAVLFPLTGLEVEAVYRLVKNGTGENGDIEDVKDNEIQTIFKFYF